MDHVHRWLKTGEPKEVLENHSATKERTAGHYVGGVQSGLILR